MARPSFYMTESACFGTMRTCMHRIFKSGFGCLIGALYLGGLLASVEAIGWTEVECPETPRSLQERYGMSAMLEDFESSSSSWKAEAGEQNARAATVLTQGEKHQGQHALEVEYTFGGKTNLEYVAVERPLRLPDGAVGLGYWIKHGSSPLTLAVRLADASGEVHQFTLEEASQDADWHFVAGRFEHGISWGGDNNKKMDPPLTLHSLVFDRPRTGFKGSGTLWIDEVQTVQPTAPPPQQLHIAVTEKRFGHVYSPGETIRVQASGATNGVGWKVVDYQGNILVRGTDVKPEVQIEYAPTRPGYYAFVFERGIGGKVVETREYRCAVIPEMAEPPTNAFVGFCTHFGHESYPLETMDLMKRYGFRRYRDEIAWPAVEHEKNKYALPAFAARYLEHSRALGMEPLIIFDYAHPAYDKHGYPNSDEAIQGFASYAKALAELTRGTVSEFEIWNEWVGGCGMEGRPGEHDSKAYGKLMGRVYPAVKEARPDATLVGIGGEYGTQCAQNIAQSLQVAGATNMDAFSIHPYRYPTSPEASDFTEEMCRMVDGVAKLGAHRRMWLTEIGYPTHLAKNGVDEATQARFAVRTLALAQGSGAVEKLHWYDFKNDGLQREYNEHNFGVVLHQTFDCAPKPAVVAMSVFVRMTAGATCAGHVDDNQLHAVNYRRANGQEVVILWKTGGKENLNIKGETLQMHDIMGAPLDPNTKITVSDEPIYLSGSKIHWKRP